MLARGRRHRRRHSRRASSSFAIAAAMLAAASSAARAQIATLDKGHSLLVTKGLQIWGLDSDSTYQVNYANFTAANMSSLFWGNTPSIFPTAGMKWGKWVDYTGSPATALNA